MTVAEKIALYTEHLQNTAKEFNSWAAHRGLPVRINPQRAITAIESGVGMAGVKSFWESSDHSGRVHETQVRTILDCMDYLLKNDQRWGLILGAMQS
ncbi:MAG TPA: hypothetical protein VK859_06110, partial [bacterium]|nr:hypothetical protein [bacterium]